MKTIRLGNSSLNTTRLAYGCWRLAGTWNAHEVTREHRAQGRRAIVAAYEAGFTLFDHADIYCDGVAETIFGEALKQVSGMRAKIVVASKCGIRPKGLPDTNAPYRYDSSAEHIISSCETSLKRMGLDAIDLYQIHRPDYLAHPEEIALAFDKLKEAGKAREFGVSNFRPAQLALLQKACPMKLIVNQVEISLYKPDCLDDGTLDQCLAETITPLAWGPLAGGRISSGDPIDMRGEDHVRRKHIREELELIGRARGLSRGVIALAWLLKHPAKIVPIIGATQPEHIRDLAKAAKVDLTRDEWYRLMEAARGERLP